MEEKSNIGEYPTEFQYLIRPYLMMTVEDGVTEMFLNLNIEVTGKVGDVKINKIKFQKQHKFNLIEMVRILANNEELNIGLAINEKQN